MLFGGKKKHVHIEGMSCEHCAKKVKSCLEEITDVRKVKVHLDKKEAIISYQNTLDNELIQRKIEELGYTVTGMKDIS